jgi:acetyl esterase/lipase
MSEDILSLPPPSANARIAYGNDANQFGDLWLPATPGPHPTVIVIHGGYWRARYDLAYFGHCCADLAAHGIAAWNIEYRRVGNAGGGWPGTFQDVAAAANYLRTIAPSYQLQLNTLTALGHSAGGHLALWLAARHRLNLDEGLALADPIVVTKVVALAAVSDLQSAWQRGLSNGAAAELVGGTPQEFPERYKQGSPAALLPLGVRQYLVHGRADDAVPFEISEQYVAKARTLADPAELIELENTGHFECVDPRTWQWERVREALKQ